MIKRINNIIDLNINPSLNKKDFNKNKSYKDKTFDEIFKEEVNKNGNIRDNAFDKEIKL